MAVPCPICEHEMTSTSEGLICLMCMLALPMASPGELRVEQTATGEVVIRRQRVETPPCPVCYRALEHLNSREGYWCATCRRDVSIEEAAPPPFTPKYANGARAIEAFVQARLAASSAKSNFGAQLERASEIHGSHGKGTRPPTREISRELEVIGELVLPYSSLDIEDQLLLDVDVMMRDRDGMPRRRYRIAEALTALRIARFTADMGRPPRRHKDRQLDERFNWGLCPSCMEWKRTEECNTCRARDGHKQKVRWGLKVHSGSVGARITNTYRRWNRVLRHPWKLIPEKKKRKRAR